MMSHRKILAIARKTGLFAAFLFPAFATIGKADRVPVIPLPDKQLIVPSIDAPHPRLFLTPARIEAIAKAIEENREPVAQTWNTLQAQAERLVTPAIAPNPYTGPDSRKFYDACLRDASIARDLALAYTFSGDGRYAEKALEFLSAWIGATPLPGSRFDPNIHYPATGMFVARSIFSFVWTYDLLYRYPGFDERTKEGARLWFSLARLIIETGGLRWAAHDYFDKQYFNNHLIAEAMGLTMIGYALGDRELVQFAIDHPVNPIHFKKLLAGAILMPGDDPYYREPGVFPIHAGEMYDRYRHFEIAGHFGDYITQPNKGLLYSSLSMQLLSLTAVILCNNGIDFFKYKAPGGENIELVFTFYSDFYRLKDSSLHTGFYEGETERIGKDGDSSGIFEIGAFYYPQNESLQKLLASIPRAEQRTLLLGWPALLYGIQ